MTVNTITSELAAVRARECPLCQTAAGGPCQPKPEGDHLARYLDAVTAGKLAQAYMMMVLAEMIVIDTCAVITVPLQASGEACEYCGRHGQQLMPCCEHHPDAIVCADVAGCRDFLLAQIEARDEAEYMAEPEGYCITCGANLAHFFGYEGPQHFRGPHKLVTGLERRELFDADHEPVIAWRPAGAR